MKQPWFWTTIIIVGIVGLFIIFRIFAPKPSFDSAQDLRVSVVEAGEAGKVGAGGALELETDGNSLPKGWQKVDGKDFTINVPLTWLVIEDINNQLNVDSFSLRYSLASSETSEAYGDPDVVQITISNLQKNNRTLADVVNTFGKNEKEAEALVELMTKNANPPFNKLTKDDIKISQSDVVLNNGTVAKKIVFQCLKTCYLEGPAKTIVQYFIETPDSFFELTADTPTGEKTEVLLLVAEQVVKTFEVK
ncbi:MAG: hypothetical protein V1716_02450 [Candidatus Uhrbacteria bacterium]